MSIPRLNGVDMDGPISCRGMHIFAEFSWAASGGYTHRSDVVVLVPLTRYHLACMCVCLKVVGG